METLSSNIPIIQLNFDNQANDRGQVEIKFKIVNFILIVFGLANVSMILAAIFTDSIPVIGAVLFLVVTYSFMLFAYLSELRAFRSDIEPMTWENETNPTRNIIER